MMGNERKRFHLFKKMESLVTSGVSRFASHVKSRLLYTHKTISIVICQNQI